MGVSRLSFLIPTVACIVAIQAAEPTRVVRDVVIDGTKRVHEERVRFLLEVRSTKTYSDAQLRQAVADDVRAIEKMGPFTGTRGELRFSDDGREVTIIYHFTELPYVAKVALAGIGYFDREKAEKILTTKVGSYLNPMLLENDRRAVERLFQDSGHRWCRVRADTAEDRGNISVVFVVELGQDVEVGQVNYIGLPDGARPLAIDKVLLMPKGASYQPELVDLDAQAVVRKLQDLGWLDAKLVSVQREVQDYVRPNEARRRHGPDLAPDGYFNDRMILTYTVDAGARYRLGKVSFVGNTIATQQQLRSAFGMPEGAWFKRDDLEGEPRAGGSIGAIERSRRVISNQGYARCRLAQDRHQDLENHIVDLVLHVSEGRKYRIGRVDIQGNEHTRDAVVRRALFLNPGDLWNDDARDESRDQINRTGVFKSTPPRPVAVEMDFPDDRPEEVDLIARVEEDSTGSVNFQVGYSSATKLFGSVGYTERNFDLLGFVTSGIEHFRGANQSLEFQASWSEPATQVSATWTNPHVMDGPYSLSTTASRSDSTLREWAERRITGSGTVGRNFLKNRLNINLGYSYTDLKITNLQITAPDDALAGKYYLNTWTLGQNYDRLKPSRIAPTSGFALSATQGVTGDFMPSSADFAEYTGKGDAFVPVAEFEDGGVTYFHLSARWREEEALGETPIVPFYQRYRDGGAAPRHRGFDYDDLSPKQINRNGFLSNIGGTRNALATLEFSVPVQQTNEGVRLIAFADYGNVWAEGEAVDYKDLRTAIGFGVRFPIQIPVALDFAWLLQRRPGESASHVQFGLGNIRF
ncbi:MAG: outer membrane protein assembly factor BamA [Planctomycetes bacterium]|nr:outer membrane protein assembly factor BamA [Planctomycetota bacterium]